MSAPTLQVQDVFIGTEGIERLGKRLVLTKNAPASSSSDIHRYSLVSGVSQEEFYIGRSPRGDRGLETIQCGDNFVTSNFNIY